MIGAGDHAHKVRNDDDIAFLKSNIKDMEFLGAIKFSQSVMDSDLGGISPFKGATQAVEEIKQIKQKLVESFGKD